MKTNADITARSLMTTCRIHVAFGIRNAAFTFIEVLFSVVILGVGLIMIAGMLPVAIKQNADTRNDLTAKVVCDSGYAFVRTLIQQHPEAFPETCGDRGSAAFNGIPNFNGGLPFVPKANTMLDEFMGNQLMKLNTADGYTPAGSSPPANPDYTAVDSTTGVNKSRTQWGFLRAGRTMPLSYDVTYPAGTGTNGGYDVGNLIANQAWNDDSTHIVKRHPATSDYVLGWHQLVLGDRIVSSEPRFQWLAFYRRDEGSKVIKLVIVAMRQQSSEVTDRYDIAKTLPNEKIGDPSTPSGTAIGNGPFLVPVEIEDSLTGPDIVKFLGTPGIDAWDVDVAETGSFLIIAHSPPLKGQSSPPTADAGDVNRPFRNNGKIFRLAARRDDLDSAQTGRVWELAPGFDLDSADAGPDQIFGTPDDVPDGSMNKTTTLADNNAPNRSTSVHQYPVTDPNGSGARYVDGTRAYAWIIGRGHLDPTLTNDPTGGAYTGATQDLGVLSVDVPLP